MENKKLEKRAVVINGKEYSFIFGKSPKFEKDLSKVISILEKDTLSATDRFELLSIYNPSYHKGGKIEGVTSFDSSATNCGFCQNARNAAKNNPLHICGGCYDYSQENSFKGANIVNRHTLNMIIMSSVEFTKEELSILDVSKIDRVNSSGDVPNKTYACNMIKLAYINEFAHFGFWAKNVLPVIAACDELGKPENMVLVQSSCIIGRPVKLAKYFDYVFTVYPDEETTTVAIEKGACACNGRKCKECGYKCYFGTWPVGANIAELYKGTKEQKAALKSAM